MNIPPARNTLHRRAIFVALLLVGLSLSFSAAHASGLSAPSVGNGRSSVIHDDAASVFWNPGNLGFIEEPQLMGGANLILGSIRYTRSYRGVYQRPDSFDFQTPIDPEDVDATKVGAQPDSNHLVVGPQPDAFVAIPIRDTGLVAGVGFYLPYVATVNYPEDGPQRFHIQDALIAAAYLTPTISYRLNEHFSFGAGVSAVVGYAQLNRVQDFAAVDDLGAALEGPPVFQENDFGADAPTAVRELDVLARPASFENMLALGFTFNLGATVAFDNFRFGASYQHSTRLNFRGRFALDMNNDFFTQDLAAQGLQFDPLVRGDASLSFTLPNAINLGASYALSDRFRLAATFAYNFWSTVEAFDVVLRSDQLAQPDVGLGRTQRIELPRRWQNAFAIEAFASYQISDLVDSWASVGFQQNAVPDSTIDASSPDGDRLVFGAGAVFDVNERFDVITDLKINHVLTREVVGSDYDIGNGEYGLTLLSIGAHLNIALGPAGRPAARRSADEDASSADAPTIEAGDASVAGDTPGPGTGSADRPNDSPVAPDHEALDAEETDTPEGR